MKKPRRAYQSRKAARPFVFLNAAMTADGKLAPATRRYEPFGSPRDSRLLYELRATADAILCGARTVYPQPTTLGPGGPRYRRLRLRHGLAEYALRVIASGRGQVNPRAEIFKRRFSPIIILTTRRAGPERLRRLGRLADAVHVCGEEEIDWPRALRWLRQHWGVKRLLGEGGGALNGALFDAGVVDEVFVTICPLVLGGREAPTLADGQGAPTLGQATRLELLSRRRAGEEVFLRYRVVKGSGGPERGARQHSAR